MSDQPVEIDACCTECGYRFELATAVNGPTEPPRAGSMSLCFRCGNVDAFDEVDGKIVTRPLTAEEAEEVAGSHTIQEARARFVLPRDDYWRRKMQHEES